MIIITKRSKLKKITINVGNSRLENYVLVIDVPYEKCPLCCRLLQDAVSGIPQFLKAVLLQKEAICKIFSD